MTIKILLFIFQLYHMTIIAKIEPQKNQVNFDYFKNSNELERQKNVVENDNLIDQTRKVSNSLKILKELKANTLKQSLGNNDKQPILEVICLDKNRSRIYSSSTEERKSQCYFTKTTQFKVAFSVIVGLQKDPKIEPDCTDSESCYAACFNKKCVEFGHVKATMRIKYICSNIFCGVVALYTLVFMFLAYKLFKKSKKETKKLFEMESSSVELGSDENHLEVNSMIINHNFNSEAHRKLSTKSDIAIL